MPPSQKATTKRKSAFYSWWPKLTNEKDAKDASVQGVFAAGLNAVATTLFVATGGIPTTSLLDAAVFAAIGFGIYKMSRIAAVTGLLAYVAERLVTPTNIFSGANLIMMIALTMCFINAVRSTFAYHKLRHAQAA